MRWGLKQKRQTWKKTVNNLKEVGAEKVRENESLDEVGETVLKTEEGEDVRSFYSLRGGYNYE